MGSLSLPHLIILGAIALIFFGGRNKISDIMGDVAKGIKSFKKGLSDDDEKVEARPAEPARTLDHQPATVADLSKVSEAPKAS
ncbi:MAG: twin-arginine translocase TatA/TatE family subunit [Beijerinckiaceae bacterium]|nr:twin-arginine translocase TatA/TatE family subunit [Beijerinckiaceae bacterium]